MLHAELKPALSRSTASPRSRNSCGAPGCSPAALEAFAGLLQALAEVVLELEGDLDLGIFGHAPLFHDMVDTIESLRAELAETRNDLRLWKGQAKLEENRREDALSCLDEARVELAELTGMLAAEKEAWRRAEAETERIRNLSLHFCDGPPDDPNVLLRRRIVDRLLAIEREARRWRLWDAKDVVAQNVRHRSSAAGAGGEVKTVELVQEARRHASRLLEADRDTSAALLSELADALEQKETEIGRQKEVVHDKHAAMEDWMQIMPRHKADGDRPATQLLQDGPIAAAVECPASGQARQKQPRFDTP